MSARQRHGGTAERRPRGAGLVRSHPAAPQPPPRGRWGLRSARGPSRGLKESGGGARPFSPLAVTHPRGQTAAVPTPLGCGPPGQPCHLGYLRPPPPPRPRPRPRPGFRPRPQPRSRVPSTRGPAEGRPLPPFSEERRPPIAASVTPLTPPPLRMHGSGARARAPPPPSPTAAPATPSPRPPPAI